MDLKKIICSILFSTNKPVDYQELLGLVKKGLSNLEEEVEDPKWTIDDVTAALKELDEGLKGVGLCVTEIAGGVRMATAPEQSPWANRSGDETRAPRLSHPALETLAVIAYRQPISRAEIEAVRGVAVGGVLETLIDRGVINVAGRADVPGRPLIYETTEYFLEHFGLRGLEDLPNVEELKRVKLPEPPSEDESQQQELIHEPTGTPQEDRPDRHEDSPAAESESNPV